MKYILEICAVFTLAIVSFLPSVKGQDTSDYLTVQMFQGLCWYTVTNEAGYVIASNNDASGIDMITALTCKLTIQAPAKNQGVLFQFTSFNVTESPNCVDDAVLIFDGEDTAAEELTPENGLCGDFDPGSYMSSGRALTILFFTDQLADGYVDYDYTSMFRGTWTAYRGAEDDVSSSYESYEPIGSDELFCCESSDACIDLRFACDGISNCEDGSDEGPAACTVDYGLFGSLEIFVVVLVALSLVTSFFAFIAFITCFCRSLLRSDESKRLLESTDDFIYQQAGTSGALPRSQSAEFLMERTEPMTFPGGVPRAPELYPESRPIQIIETSVDRDRQLLRRQASLEDRARNVVYNENAAPVMDEETYRNMIMSNFSWRLPRPQVQEPLVRSRSTESIVSFGDWDNFWLVQRVTDEESSQTTAYTAEPERVRLGIDPYEVIPDTLYMNESRSRHRADRPSRSDMSSHRRSRSLSPSGRSRFHHEDSSVSRDPFSPDEEYHLGRSRIDYDRLANMQRTRDMPRFFLGPSPSAHGSEV